MVRVISVVLFLTACIPFVPVHQDPPPVPQAGPEQGMGIRFAPPVDPEKGPLVDDLYVCGRAPTGEFLCVDFDAFMNSLYARQKADQEV